MRRALVAALLLCLAVAGCGVPADDRPRDIAGPGGVRSGEPAPDGLGPAVVRLYLVRDGRLALVSRRVPGARTPAEQLDALLAGPTADERARGLTSALTTMTQIRVTVAERRATVEIGDLTDPGARNDRVLAFGQIVCTLTSRGADVGTVSFISGGEPLGVPRANGSLATGPLTIADYAPLIDD